MSKKRSSKEDRALKEAEASVPVSEHKKQIRDEYQVKIDEARAKDEEIKLENQRAFEERKTQLENEIALQREQDQKERKNFWKNRSMSGTRNAWNERWSRFRSPKIKRTPLRELLARKS